MEKLNIQKQASKCSWWEDPLGTFHVCVVATNTETAKNCRTYLPLMSKFLLLGFNGRKKPKQKAKISSEVK